MNRIQQSENIEIQHSLNGGEYVIPGTRYKADGFCTENNTIYEFYGDCFHGNPKVFCSHDFCHPYIKDTTAGELFKQTIHREQLIRSLGFNLVTMWENEYDKTCLLNKNGIK